MRARFMSLVGTVVLCVASVGVHAQEEESVEKFMRVKLMQSQNVLEGLATEDFDLIAKSSQEISLLSLASTWQVIQTPEYNRQSAEFRRAVNALTESAKKKNLDGATLSYVNVTMKCVACHKYVRSVRDARLTPDIRERIFSR